MIRRACLADAEALQELAIASFCAAFEHLYAPEDLKAFLAESYALETLRRQISFADRPVWLAENPEGGLVGYAQASVCELPVDPMPEGALQLQRLYVDASNLSAGIGARLMEQVLNWVNVSGRPSLLLGVWSGNLRAHEFYKRYGFYKIGEYDFPVGAQLDREFILRRD